MRAQRGLADAARERTPGRRRRCRALGVVRVDLEDVLGVPATVVRAPRLRADVVLGEDAAGGEDQRVRGPRALVGRHVLGHHELALAAHEPADVHDRRAVGRRRRCTATASMPTSSSFS